MARGRSPSCSQQSVERLLLKLRRLEPAQRRIVWAAYRLCRRFAQPELSEERVLRTSSVLAEYAHRGAPYAVVALAIKLAQAYTRLSLRNAGSAGRASRAHAQEAFHLLRLALQTRLGLRISEEHPSVRFGNSAPQALVEAWSDGSVRAGRAAAGVTVLNAAGVPVVEATQLVDRPGALEAELAAAQLGLSALRDHGAQHARLNVDSLGVLRAFQGRLALKYCIEEALLLQMAHSFLSLEVRLVPRAFNSRADQLASGALLSKAN